MRILRGIEIGTTFNRPILTLGTYDGVHLGHQTIIRKLVKRAKEQQRESVLFTFEPHPRMVLQPDNHGLQLIDNLEDKLKKLESLGLDTVILFPFTKAFSTLSAQEFVQQILVDAIGVSEVHIGYDHHFGKDRKGDFNELSQMGLALGFQVFQTDKVSSNDMAISSTKIRNAILDGQLEMANEFLGEPFQISGEVVHGNKLGRTIGFPTANLKVDYAPKLIPKNGVYAVEVMVKNQLYKGVMNIGNKPTVQGTKALFLEVFIFNFSEEIYGEHLVIRFFHRLRDEQKFDGIEALKTQLKKDEELARKLLFAPVSI